MNILRWPRQLVEQVVGWRHFNFGPATAGFTHTLMMQTCVNWSEFGLDAQWAVTDDSHTLHLRLGPAGLYVIAGGYLHLVLPAGDGSVETRQVGDRFLHLYRRRGHLGAAVETGRCRGRRATRIEIGPFGLLVEPM